MDGQMDKVSYGTENEKDYDKKNQEIFVFWSMNDRNDRYD